MTNWLGRLLTPRPGAGPTSAASAHALKHWSDLPPAAIDAAHFETRYIVLNTEASGLDIDKDKLLAVAAVAVDRGVLNPHDSYYGALAPAPDATLAELLLFSGKHPLVVFNAAFNRSVIERALEEHLGVTVTGLWIDLYFLLPALFPQHQDRPVRLAAWMESFGIDTFQRHHALGDAWAIAQLLLAAQAKASARGAHSPQALADIERSYRQQRSRL